MTPRLIGSCCCSQVPAHFLDHLELYINSHSVGINFYYSLHLTARFKIDDEWHPKAEPNFDVDYDLRTSHIPDSLLKGFELDIYDGDEKLGKIKYDNVVYDERTSNGYTYVYSSSGRLSLTFDKDFEIDYWWLSGPTWHLVAPAGTYVAPNASANRWLTGIEGDIVY